MSLVQNVEEDSSLYQSTMVNSWNGGAGCGFVSSDTLLQYFAMQEMAVLGKNLYLILSAGGVFQHCTASYSFICGLVKTI